MVVGKKGWLFFEMVRACASGRVCAKPKKITGISGGKRTRELVQSWQDWEDLAGIQIHAAHCPVVGRGVDQIGVALRNDDRRHWPSVRFKMGNGILRCLAVLVPHPDAAPLVAAFRGVVPPLFGSAPFCNSPRTIE